ncbi:hypothetical protein PHMEG_0007964 [Phytophthora megakarya]|uniref:Uncharacterized protein n=1 Tax=Phytophthora megakarya TaxID=4795 RepID=A0A225WJW1_9STRA|nr:hypothetical protein PHMEG_0007964 [Phytophthora megakarya]
MASNPRRSCIIGPVHTPELTEFCYVRVREVDGETAIVHVVGPEIDDDGQDILVPVTTSELREVDVSEAELWPGQWAYGTVSRYEVSARGTWLSVIHGEKTVSVALTKPLRVIKAYPITYALQIDATISDMVINSRELLHIQDVAIKACRKHNGEYVTSNRSALSVPFAPDELVVFIRPHNLSTVTKDPHVTTLVDESTTEHCQDESLSLDDLLRISGASEDENVQGVRTLNQRYSATVMTMTSVTSPADVEPFGPRQLTDATIPANVISAAVSSLQWSMGIWLLNARSHADALLNDGLVQAQDANVSYADFSQRNTLRPARTASSWSDVSNSLRNLRLFAQEFYSDEIGLITDTELFPDSDTTGWKLLAFSITSKFGKFRRYVCLHVDNRIKKQIDAYSANAGSLPFRCRCTQLFHAKVI